jgi:hypothetical protein
VARIVPNPAWITEPRRASYDAREESL